MTMPGFRGLPLAGRLYVAAVITAGAVPVVLSFPRTMPNPVSFVLLVVFACVTSAWKVTLPLPITNGSTLSVSYAANLMSLLLLGPRHAMLIAIAGAWTQCTYKLKQPYPVHRTVFSAATAVLTMAATSVTFTWLGGPDTSLDAFPLARPLVRGYLPSPASTACICVASMPAHRPAVPPWCSGPAE
jgi:hypothetical protein